MVGCMYDDIFKEALKKLLENGIFIIVLVYFGHDMMNRQDEMIKANELKTINSQKKLIETIERLAKEKNEKIDELIDCYQSKARGNE